MSENTSTKTKKKELSIIEIEQRKQKIKNFSLISGSIITSVAVLVGLFFFNPFSGGNQKVAKQEKETVNIDEEYEPIGEKTEGQFAIDEPIPVKHADWQEKSYEQSQISEDNTAEEVANFRENFISWVSTKDSNLELFASLLPSEEAGFTSDLSQAVLEDGMPNPMFSYWTKEVFLYELGMIVERFLNPYFGDWQVYQLPEYNAGTEMGTAPFADILTDEMLANAKQNPQILPVYADWNGDNYGGGQYVDASRWFGEVVSSSVRFEYDNEIGHYTAYYDASIKFTAWQKDQSKVEKTGTLSLILVPPIKKDDSAIENYSSNRVLGKEGTLKVG